MHHGEGRKTSRMDILSPEEGVRPLGVRQGMILADVGCGTGYFTLPLARLVGPGGFVFAIDVLEERLKDGKARADREGLVNIAWILGQSETIPLPAHSVDGVLLSVVLHELDHPVKIVHELNRITRPGGCLWVVEWQGGYDRMGPSEEEKWPPEQTGELLKKCGYRVGETAPMTEAFYLLKATKK